MAETRIEIARKDIFDLFDHQEKKIFMRAELSQILTNNRKHWRLRQGETVESFITFLLKGTKLKRRHFKFPNRSEVRYTWGRVPLYELILSTKPNSYYTHYTAMFFHELTEQVPKTIYLNHEQGRESVSSGSLTQEAIDRAFKSAQRMSKNFVSYQGFKVCVINGRKTNQLGVVDMIGPDGARMRCTDIERTLIDATVRTAYAGGVFEVLKAYRSARGRVSLNRLSAYLKKIRYTYPYCQAIGFYLERAGVYNQSQIDLFREGAFQFDFYLTNAMKDMAYSDDWRLFHPKGL